MHVPLGSPPLRRRCWWPEFGKSSVLESRERFSDSWIWHRDKEGGHWCYNSIKQRVGQSMLNFYMHQRRDLPTLAFLDGAAAVRQEVADETDRITGKSKQISNVPIH